MVVFLLGFAAVGGSGGLEGSMNTTSDILTAVAVVILVLLMVIGLGLGVAFFAVKYLFGVHAVAIEGKTATGGMARSGELTKKSFWHVAFSYLFGGMLFYTLPLLLTVGASMFLLVSLPAYIAAITATQVINAILYPFLVILLTVVYINLKVKKEGLDLELKVDKLLEEQKLLEDGEGQGETANV
jgi:hypothetical protein